MNNNIFRILVLSAVILVTVSAGIAQSPNLTSEATKAKQNELINKGTALQDAGKFQEALDVFNQLLVIDPNDAEACATISGLYSQMNKPDLAETWAKKAIELDPKLSGARINYGNLLFLQENYSAAESQFRKAVELDSKEVIAIYGLATVLHAQKKYKESLENYLKVLEMDSELTKALYSTAEVYYRLGQLDKSIEYVKRTLKIDRNYEGANEMLKVLESEKAAKP